MIGDLIMCVLEAIENSIKLDGVYLEELLKKRIPKPDASSCIYGVSNTTWLLDKLKGSEWVELDHVNVNEGCKCYIAQVTGSSRVRPIKDTDIVHFCTNKKTGKVIASVKGGKGKVSNCLTLITGVKNGVDSVLTLYPGLPVADKSVLTYQKRFVSGQEAKEYGFMLAQIGGVYE